MYLNLVNIIAENPQGGIPGYEVVPAIRMNGGYIILNREIGYGMKVLTRLKNGILFGTNARPATMIEGSVGSGWRIAAQYWTPYYGTCQADVWYDCEFIIARNGTPCSIKVDGVTLISSGSINSYSSQKIILFNRAELSADRTTAFQQTKIYDMQDNLIFDLQPVIRISDNAVGVYDYLSDTFIEAEGSMIPIYSL